MNQRAPIKQLFTAVSFVSLIFLSLASFGVKAQDSDIMKSRFNFKVGEEITYVVKKLGVSVGESKLIYKGPQELNGQPVELIILQTNIIKFNGEERIYLDADKLLPILVERDIELFGKKELIAERYNQTTGDVEITNTTKGKTTTQVIHKGGRVDNVQAFIFRYRRNGNYTFGEKLMMPLPLVDVELELTGEEKIDLMDENFDVYSMKGSPKNLRIWFDKSPQHVPIRIDGKFGIGNVSFILKDYQSR